MLAAIFIANYTDFILFRLPIGKSVNCKKYLILTYENFFIENG